MIFSFRNLPLKRLKKDSFAPSRLRTVPVLRTYSGGKSHHAITKVIGPSSRTYDWLTSRPAPVSISFLLYFGSVGKRMRNPPSLLTTSFHSINGARTSV